MKRWFSGRGYLEQAVAINHVHEGVPEQVGPDVSLRVLVVVLDFVVGVVQVDDLLDLPAGGPNGSQFVVHHVDEEAVELGPLADLAGLLVAEVTALLLLDLVLHDVPDVLLGVLRYAAPTSIRSLMISFSSS